MYQTKKIHYKAVFKQDDEHQTIEYKAKGVCRYDDQTTIQFQTPEGAIQIAYDRQEIHLQHGSSLLRFHKEHELWNQYQLPYGEVALKTKLIKFEANEHNMKMKYELHDHHGLLSTVYIMLSMMPYQFEEEL